MTIEEAIRILDHDSGLDHMIKFKRQYGLFWQKKYERVVREAADMGADALKVVRFLSAVLAGEHSTQTDAEAWTAEWKRVEAGIKCTSCGHFTYDRDDFCPECGKAMTPEAWEILQKRLRR